MKRDDEIPFAKFPQARILIVDDEEANVKLLARILRRAGYQHIHTEMRPADGLAAQRELQPDLILLDLHMPQMDGVEFMRRLRSVSPFPAVLMLTGDTTAAAKTRAFSGGAADFLAKPFDNVEVILRMNNLLELRHLHLQLQAHNRRLEEEVELRTQELEEARLDVLERLGRAAEFRDDATGQHTRRVGRNSAVIGKAIGLQDQDVALLARAAPLHDIGKIAIPDHILLKPGPLAEDELAIMRTHTSSGARLLSGSRSPLLQLAGDIALLHHERWDGHGYPYGRAGDEIPQAARIVALADFFDALTHDRPYRRARALSDVLRMIREQRAKHFDPEIADAFFDLFHEGRLAAVTV